MILSQKITCATRLGELKAIELLAGAGFDAIDYTMSDMAKNGNALDCDDYKTYVARLCECAKSNNIIFNQAHGVTGVGAGDPVIEGRLLLEKNKRCIEACALMGIKTLVVHPYGVSTYLGNEEQVFNMNLQYFKSLLHFAEECGVRLACENMWCMDKKRNIRRGSIFASPYEHAKMVDEINSPYFVACLDFGHTAIDGRQPQDSIRVLGNRLGALHVHDNDYLDDMHTLPGLSEMNWEEITKALAEVNYQGDFTLETNHFFDSFESEQEFKLGLKLSETIGRKMINKIEGYTIELMNCNKVKREEL